MTDETRLQPVMATGGEALHLPSLGDRRDAGKQATKQSSGEVRTLVRGGGEIRITEPRGGKPSRQALALLRSVPIEDKNRWALVPLTPGVLRNGRAVGPVAILKHGDLLTLPGAVYLVTRAYAAEIGEVPDELADRCCPVCGMELAEAPVAACSCGALYHEETDGEDPLPCFSSVPKCSSCGGEKTFEPRLFPDPQALGMG